MLSSVLVDAICDHLYLSLSSSYCIYTLDRIQMDTKFSSQEVYRSHRWDESLDKICISCFLPLRIKMLTTFIHLLFSVQSLSPYVQVQYRIFERSLPQSIVRGLGRRHLEILGSFWVSWLRRWWFNFSINDIHDRGRRKLKHKLTSQSIVIKAAPEG